MPDESMSIVLVDGSPMLTFNFSLTEKQITAFLNGTASFGLFAENDILFFLFKIDDFLDWSDLAFTIHLAGDEMVEAGPHYLPFNLVLVDSGTNIIKSLRVVTVSPAFRSMLASITQGQAKKRFDTIGYYKTIGALYEKYPVVDNMINKALIVEQGGITVPE